MNPASVGLIPHKQNNPYNLPETGYLPGLWRIAIPKKRKNPKKRPRRGSKISYNLG
jgi:hypothetical protein